MNIGREGLILLVLVILIVFAGSRLPKLLRSLHLAQREFRVGLPHARPASHHPGDDPATAPTTPDSTRKKERA